MISELANELGVLAACEGAFGVPASVLLPKLAQLNVPADELLGIKALKKNKVPDTRLQRRFQQIEKLPAKERRQLMQVIDTYLKAAQH